MTITNQDCDSTYKIVVLGQAKAGKTAFVNREKHGSFSENYEATIGISYLSKRYDGTDKTIKAQIHDIGGAERFQPITSHCLRHTDGAIICVSLEKAIDETYLNTQIERLKAANPLGAPIITLVGTKSDLKEKADSNYPALEAFAELNGCACSKSSAKNNENINETMQALVTTIAANKASELTAESPEQRAFKEACSKLAEVLKKSPVKVRSEITTKTAHLQEAINTQPDPNVKQQHLTKYLNTCLKLSGSSLLSKCIKTVVVTGVCVVFGVAAAMGICLSLGIGAGVIGIGLAAVATGTLAFGVSSAAFFKDNAVQKSIKEVGLMGEKLIDTNNPPSTPKQ